MELINNLDTELFLIINQGIANPIFDWLMPYVRNPYVWTPLYLFIVIFCIKNYGKKGGLILLGLLLSFGVADFTSASLIKPAVQRIRPCNDLSLKEEVVTRVRCGSGYSFPSTHASNHFALALFLILVFRRVWRHVTFWALLWAALICLAQVYVGVHYPLDVLAGALLGTGIGYLIGYLFMLYIPDISTPLPQEGNKTVNP